MSLDNMQYHTLATRFTNRVCGSAVSSLKGWLLCVLILLEKYFAKNVAGNLVVTKNCILSLVYRLSRVNIQIVY